jgi:hypothetical protein
VDLLSWSDPVPSKSSQPASAHDSSLWSNELFNLLDPVLSPTSSAPSAATLASPVSNFYGNGICLVKGVIELQLLSLSI